MISHILEIIPIEHIAMKNSSGSELQFGPICLTRIRSRTEDIREISCGFLMISHVLEIFLIEHIETKNSSDPKLQIDSTCPVGNLRILKVIVKIAEPWPK